ncbi:hypothetical protein [Rhodoplanes serenus]|jgi:hypothetical protein|uniref:hypothetical protein n=1 Tax=Rhodoplanes serenus TaxID=200615 RepID=UPI001FDF31BC|nr:hypothetical protein [Rhodoplanes serenus]
MPDVVRRPLIAGVVLVALAGAASAQIGDWVEDSRLRARLPASTDTVMLFKVVTVRDDIVIGLSTVELDALGGRDVGAVARALKERGTLTAWQYAARKAVTGELEQAPRQKVGLLAHDTLRVESYQTPLAVLPHN